MLVRCVQRLAIDARPAGIASNERTGDKYVVDMRDMFGRLDELYQERLADKDRLIVEVEQ